MSPLTQIGQIGTSSSASSALQEGKLADPIAAVLQGFTRSHSTAREAWRHFRSNSLDLAADMLSASENDLKIRSFG
jgi:hypothetical protein